MLRDPRDNAARYVGKTVLPLEHRKRGHISHARRLDPKRKSNCSYWILGLLALGLEPVIELLEEQPADLDVAERAWIAQLKEQGASLCNQTPGGEGGDTWGGRKHAESSKQLISQANRKSANPERAKKISDYRRQQWQDPEYRAKMLAAGKRGTERAAELTRGKPGRPVSPETRKKISDSLKKRASDG